MPRSSGYRRLPSPPDKFHADVCGVEILVRRDRWQNITLEIHRGVNPKFVDLTADQAAAIADGLTAVLSGE